MSATMERVEKPLTAQEARFVKAYVIEPNGTKAALAAGFSEKSAHVLACRLLKRVKIQAEIVKAQAKVADVAEQKFEITTETLLAELSKIGFSNMQDFMGITKDGDPYVDLSKCTREQLATLSEFAVEDYTEGRGENARDIKRVKIKHHDKLKAIELIAKLTGKFVDKHEHSGPDGQPIAHNITIRLVRPGDPQPRQITAK